MHLPPDKQTKGKLVRLASLAVLVSILVAGLWPFHAPANHVQWLADGQLLFGLHATVMSRGTFDTLGLRGEPCTIELWLTPSVTWDRRTILAFYAPNHTIPFSLHQFNRDLLVESQPSNAKPNGAGPRLYVKQVFHTDKAVFITITADGHSTSVYLNGMLARNSEELGLSGSDLVGELVIANSPVDSDSWSGSLRGFGIYRRFFTEAEALAYYQSWTRDGHPPLDASPSALYIFDQTDGRVVRNRAGHGPDLVIPGKYTILHQAFLQRPWDEYKPGWNYWKNVLFNIGGFVPLGCLLCAYFVLVRGSRQPALLAVIAGATLSITIEVLQGYLPTRDSGMTDILTNTLGAAVGAWLYGAIRLAFETLGRSRYSRVRGLATWFVGSANS